MSKNIVNINGINTNKLKKLTHDEMKELSKRYREGEYNLKDILVEGNLKLVLSILKKYQGKCDNMDDLFQIGVVGLIKSVENFDLKFDVKFSTYAVFMIEGEIKRYLRDNSQIRISRGIKELSYEIINFRENYLKENLCYPTNELICETFNIAPYELYLALNSLSDINSIYDPIYNDGGEAIYLIDQLEDSNIKDLDKLISLKEALNKIKERDRLIIQKRYFEGYSQAEIASLLSISQAQVSRIENNALNSVKKLIM
jgi:RNA polymerase sporulation-specific sigma factor